MINRKSAPFAEHDSCGIVAFLQDLKHIVTGQVVHNYKWTSHVKMYSDLLHERTSL